MFSLPRWGTPIIQQQSGWREGEYAECEDNLSLSEWVPSWPGLHTEAVSKQQQVLPKSHHLPAVFTMGHFYSTKKAFPLTSHCLCHVVVLSNYLCPLAQKPFHYSVACLKHLLQLIHMLALQSPTQIQVSLWSLPQLPPCLASVTLLSTEHLHLEQTLLHTLGRECSPFSDLSLPSPESLENVFNVECHRHRYKAQVTPQELTPNMHFSFTN